MMRTPANSRKRTAPTKEHTPEAVALTVPAGKLLKRAEAARRLGVSTSSVRRMEGSELQPIVGANGVRYFAEEQIEAVYVRIRRTRTVVPEDDSGAVAARVFERLNAGTNPADIVKDLRLEPELVERLVEQWQRLAQAVLLTRDQARLIQRALGGDPVVDEASLLAAIAEYKRASPDYCERCNTGRSVHCLECARKAGLSALHAEASERLY